MRILLRLQGGAAAVATVLVVLQRPAAAQRADVEAAAAVNVGYSQESRSTFVPDPNGMAVDNPGDTARRLFMEIRPGIAIRTGSPRLTWQAGYIFAGTLSLVGDESAAYSNQVTGAMVAELTKFTTLTIAVVGAQGGTQFQLSSRPADSGTADLRAPGNPDLITASVAESVRTELGKQTNLQHTAVASLNAPQNDLAARNQAIAASLELERTFERDGIGAELHGSVSWLRPLQLGMTLYKSYTSAALAHWNHDFSPSWNGMINAGVEQVYTDTGSKPLAFLPTGTAALRYAPQPDFGGGVEFSHGTATNLQVGSVSLTDRLGVHGAFAIDSRRGRALAFSAGVLHNEPLGQVSALVAAGSGNAAQLDAGFTTELAKNLLGTARYSFAYQFSQGGGLPDSVVHVFYLGVTGVIRNTERPILPLPVHGHRVDGGDGYFPVVEEAPVEEASPGAAKDRP